MSLKVIDTGKSTAQKNMEIDANFLENLGDEALLHIYEWEGDCATYGHFIDLEKYINLEEAKKLQVNFAKRPTGGGIVFHSYDLAFSVLIPSSHPCFSTNTLENYALVNHAVIDAIADFRGENTRASLLPEEPLALDQPSYNFCMAKPTKYDVILDGKKVGGAAQRRTKKGFLHQGSISLGQLPAEFLSRVLLPNTRVLEAMQENTFSLLGEDILKENLFQARKFLEKSLAKNLEKVLVHGLQTV
ncbi:MAG: hypothetical protein CMO81_02340 [Waddliaceae bacterium]|nr:hypothetical protein [Waddliaceae bacterium]